VPRSPRRRACAGDDGSILLSMLAMLVVSGLLLVVAATVLNGQTQTRFDRRFEQALQVAEVGHSQMISVLQSNTSAGPDQLKTYVGMTGPYSVTDLPKLAGATTDGGVYETTAQLMPVDPLTTSALLRGSKVWKVVSWGSTTPGGPKRTIESELRVRPLYSLAAYGKTTLDFNGGNGASSYDSKISKDLCMAGSTTQRVDVGTPLNAASNTGEVQPCDKTGVTTVATNGTLRLDGNSRVAVQRAEVHNAKSPFISDPLLDATGECEAQTCSLKDEGPPRLYFYREPIEPTGDRVCKGAAGSEGAFSGAGTLGSRAYYFSDVTLDGRTVFTGTPPTTANPTAPTVLCISGRLTISNAQLVNFESYVYGGATLYRPRQPGGLTIIMTGASNPEVKIGGGSSIAATILAPNAAVTGGAQANVYGSLIANSIVNQGGWNFFYDQDLAGLMLNASVSVRDWRERF